MNLLIAGLSLITRLYVCQRSGLHICHKTTFSIVKRLVSSLRPALCNCRCLVTKKHHGIMMSNRHQLKDRPLSRPLSPSWAVFNSPQLSATQTTVHTSWHEAFCVCVLSVTSCLSAFALFYVYLLKREIPVQFDLWFVVSLSTSDLAGEHTCRI